VPQGTWTCAASSVHEAIAVLSEKLGILETVRFPTQFATGLGGYTRERDTIFRGLTTDEILSEIRRTHRRRRFASMMRIEYLADHLSLVPTLAEWHHRQWSHFRPDEAIDCRVEGLRESARRDRCPVTFVALSEGELLGSASLVAHDMEIRPHLTPWLADLYVAPLHRRRGIGSALVHRVVEEASRLGFPVLFLFTTSKKNENLYANLGWTVRERVEYLGKLRVVMQVAPHTVMQPARPARSNGQRKTTGSAPAR
jgi:GNAT superfamily N-acetyltransferase